MSSIPPPPPPPMGPPPGFQAYNASGGFGGAVQRNGRALAAMICGIVGLLICSIVLAPVALFLGISSRSEIDRNPGLYNNRGQAVAGIVLGVIGICLIPVSFILLSRVKN